MVYLRSDVELIDEVDLLDELLAGIGGQVLLHLLQQGVGLELLGGIGHSFVCRSLALRDVQFFLTRRPSVLRRFMVV